MPVVTLTASTQDGLLGQAGRVRELWSETKRAHDGAGELLIEFRLDLLDDPNHGPRLVAELGRGVLVTARLSVDGGSGRLDSIERRRRLLFDCCSAGAEWIDLEWDAGFEDLDFGDTKRVLSIHDFHGDRKLVEQAVHEMGKQGPDRIKVATHSRDASNLAWVLDLDDELSGSGTCFAMGEAGRLSRWRPLVRDGCDDWIYASGGRLPAAPGQPTFTEILQHAPRFWGAVKGAGRFMALLGNPTRHSLSPAAFNSVFETEHEPAFYVTLPSADISYLDELIPKAPLAGFSVTAPHKREAIEWAHDTSAQAREAGSANTLVAGDSAQFIAHNTDVVGVLEPFAAVLSGSNKTNVATSLVVGAGGAARGAVVALKRISSRVLVAARLAEQSSALARELGVRSIPLGEAAAGGFDLMVNATPVGGPTQLNCSPLPSTAHRGAIACLDMNYRPEVTPFLQDARDAGAQALGGLLMFCEQAREQWRLFFPSNPQGASLLSDVIEASARSRRCDLVLIGGRGSGKTTVARQLAVETHRHFVDMDEMLESSLGMSIDRFFRKHGEVAFRMRESELSVALSRDPNGGRIIATGGGAILMPEGGRALVECGPVVFLDVTPEIAHQRIVRDTTRRPPLTDLSAQEEIAEVLKDRRPLYLGAADRVVDATASVDEVVQQLNDILKASELSLET